MVEAPNPMTQGVVRAVDQICTSLAAAGDGLQILDRRASIEGRLPESMSEELRAAGVYRLAPPRAHGGLESTPMELLHLIEVLAQRSGAASWNLCTSLGMGLAARELDEDGQSEVFASPDVVFAGSMSELGRAAREPGGLRVSGTWNFGSGCLEADWLAGPCTVAGESGETLRFFVPAQQATIRETWDAIGLNGTGSHTWELEDVFVPRSRLLSAAALLRRWPGSRVRFPLPWLAAVHFSAVATGIAQRSIGAMVELAQANGASSTRVSSGSSVIVRAAVGRASVVLDAARHHRDSVVAELWSEGDSGGAVSPVDTSVIRLAGAHAVEASVGVVRTMYECAGSRAVLTSSSLGTALRDVEVIAQNPNVSSLAYELAGQVVMGEGTPRGPLSAFGLF